jgi:hypothetical protein
MAPEIPFVRKNKAQVVMKYDFVSDYNPNHFSNWLGSDGQLVSDGGLVLNSKTFHLSRTGQKGFLDNYKLALYYNQVIEFSRKHETLVQGLISNKQVFPAGSPFPGSFGKRVQNMSADPRLAHGQFSIIDPKKGLMAGFLVTDDEVFVIYGLDDALSGCDIKCGVTSDCVPCGNSVVYTCANFWEDPSYQLFKQNMTQENYSRFLVYLSWRQWCNANNNDLFDWDLFQKFQKQYPSICAAPVPKQAFADWLSIVDYEQYCASNDWPRWLAGYKDAYSCTLGSVSPAAACIGESCSTALFGRKPGCQVCQTSFSSTCSHKYLDGSNCYESTTKLESETYGPKRSCCCPKVASFTDLISVQKRESCDPYCDYIDVAIGVDRSASTLNFYIGQMLVYQIVGIGRRTADSNRVIEFGGYSKTMDLESALVSFGTGTLVDAALPNNVARWRVTENNIAMSALTPTRPTTSYLQIYKNPTGELLPIVAEQTFAEPVANERFRVWGQGDIFRIRQFSVMTRRPVRGYENATDYAKAECCGFVRCNSGNASGCLSNTCDVEDDSLADYLDGRDFEIEFLQPNKPAIGDAAFLTPAGGKRVRTDGGAVNYSETCVRARIVKTEQGKRYWDRNCSDDFHPLDPYM